MTAVKRFDSVLKDARIFKVAHVCMEKLIPIELHFNIFRLHQTIVLLVKSELKYC